VPAFPLPISFFPFLFPFLVTQFRHHDYDQKSSHHRCKFFLTASNGNIRI
jgi:hypothetical protein